MGCLVHGDLFVFVGLLSLVGKDQLICWRESRRMSTAHEALLLDLFFAPGELSAILDFVWPLRQLEGGIFIGTVAEVRLLLASGHLAVVKRGLDAFPGARLETFFLSFFAGGFGSKADFFNFEPI